MARTDRLAYLSAAPEEGLRLGDPHGPHALLTPEGVRLHRVRDAASGVSRTETVPWDRVRGLRVDAPVRRRPGLGRAILKGVGALLASDLPTAPRLETEMTVELDVAAPGDGQADATWRFTVLTMKAGAFSADDVAPADALVADFARSSEVRARLADPEALLAERR